QVEARVARGDGFLGSALHGQAAAARNAGVGGVHIADHFHDEVVQLLAIGNVRQHGLVLVLGRGPVDAVHVGIVEAVLHDAPGFLENLAVLGGNIDLHPDGEGDAAWSRAGGGRAGSGGAHGERLDPAALPEINAAAVASPLGLAATAESAASAAAPAAGAGIGHGGIEAREVRAVFIDGVHGGSAARARCVVGAAAHGGEQIGAAIGGRHRIGHRACHMSELRDAPVDAVPHDLDLHRRGGGARATPAAASGGGLVAGRHGLLLAIDLVGVGRFVGGLQGDRVKLGDGAVQRGHGRRAGAADQQQLLAIGRPAGAARLQKIVAADHVLLPAGQFLHPHMGTQQLILPREGNELAVGRILRGGDTAGIALRHNVGFTALHVHHAQLVVAAAPHQGFRIGRPSDTALVAIGVADLPRVLAGLVGEVDFLAAGTIADDGDPLSVGRPARLLLFPGSLADALRLAFVGGDGEDFAVRHHGGALVGGRKVEALGVAEGDQFYVVLLGIRLDIDDDFAGLAGSGVEFPEAEVLLVDDGLAVGGDAGEKEVAVAVAGDAGLLAALIGDL